MCWMNTAQLQVLDLGKPCNLPNLSIPSSNMSIIKGSTSKTSVCLYAQSFSHVQFFCDSMECNSQAPLSVVFSRQEYWNGLPLPPLGDFPGQGSTQYLLHLLHWKVDSFTTKPLGKPPLKVLTWFNKTLNIKLFELCLAYNTQSMNISLCYPRFLFYDLL